MTPTVLLVCGGRKYNDEATAFAALDAFHKRHGITLILHGNATGADTLADRWASSRGILFRRFPADWYPNGGPLDRRAGFRRNQQMLDQGKPDGVVAFPGHRGTADMTRRALLAGLPVWCCEGRRLVRTYGE